jgi:hypothetical protein
MRSTNDTGRLQVVMPVRQKISQEAFAALAKMGADKARLENAAPAGDRRAVPQPRGLLSEYMTLEQVAKELGVCRETLARWARLGKGPPKTRVGRGIYYSRTGIAAWLRAQET